MSREENIVERAVTLPAGLVERLRVMGLEMGKDDFHSLQVWRSSQTMSVQYSVDPADSAKAEDNIISRTGVAERMQELSVKEEPAEAVLFLAWRRLHAQGLSLAAYIARDIRDVGAWFGYTKHEAEKNFAARSAQEDFCLLGHSGYFDPTLPEDVLLLSAVTHPRVVSWMTRQIQQTTIEMCLILRMPRIVQTDEQEDVISEDVSLWRDRAGKR